MAVNRTYKSSVFFMLFSAPDILRETYAALGGVALPPEVAIEINTLEGALYRRFLNDVSFLAGKKLIVLMEHQSTINPNMALRILQYITRLYELITAGKNLYGRKEIALPVPEFFVLYNGTEPYPDETVIKLSDLFEDVSSFGIPKDHPPALELSVKVIK
jgi:hypothetical protein